MRTVITRYFAYLLGVIMVTSCVPNLDLDRLDAQSVNSYYKNADDANAATIALYGLIRDLYRDEVINVPNVVAADDGIPFLTGNADRVALWNYNITSVNTFIGSIWASSYTGIQRSNVVLNRVSPIAMDETLKNQFLGEARFLRALHYFNLVRFYGGVPIELNEVTSLENVALPRSSVDAVYDVIIADLQEAINTLPTQYTGTDIGRATKGAARGLLAKVYLTRAGTDGASPYWQEAASQAKTLIDMGIYDLWDDYAQVFSLQNRCGKESLFEVLYITNLSGNNFTTGYAPRGAPIVPGTGSGILRVSKDLFDSYGDTDSRKAVTFLTSYTNPSSGALVQLSADNTDPALAVSFWKLADLTSTVGGAGGKSFPVLRYSDILLIYAEALNEANNGPTAEAYWAINRVRNRAQLTSLAGLSKQQFKEAVLSERRKELCFEGNRWFDLVRTGQLVEAVKNENSFSRNAAISNINVRFPIPQREMDINESLVQNEGY
ncbi:RagB/SusD family nutrient uptake outer membrane protein [Olivibacter sitiensis]|uniref:RagB/SusD family nutrient uptake outer membrane protein n=1 Tax=Olivibacter sitiensis TaxID=376470 RepID=UPI0004897E8C|nr:RagB/SusD family nutrient uptake outer membrane protein [Olivibacter sitiensis]